MAVEAPLSKFKKNNLRIYIAICIGLAIWCAYDGYFNENWIKEHIDADGNPETYLVVNRHAPPYFIGGAILLGVYLFVIRSRKIIAGENELVICDKEIIPYDSIEKIDKTYFDSKGYFVITYKNENGGELTRKISDRTYDNLAAILDELVAKIS